jgi:hypothetical protein
MKVAPLRGKGQSDERSCYKQQGSGRDQPRHARARQAISRLNITQRIHGRLVLASVIEWAPN